MNAIAGTLGYAPIMSYKLSGVRWFLFLAGFTTFAVAAPYICHQFGLAGQFILPMHFAVIFAAMVIGLRGGILTALASPTISFVLSGMPPAANLFPMTVELVTYAAVAGFLVHQRRMGILAALVCSMIAGRLMSLLFLTFGLGLAPSLSQHLRTVFLIGLPGIVVQLALLPPAVSRIGAYLHRADA